MAYQRALNEKVRQLSVPPETSADELPESRHHRIAWEKEMKEYVATLDAMSAHRCDNSFFDIKFGHNPFGITLATRSIGHDALIQVGHSQTCLPNFC
jgi:hypothetical protein